MATPITHTVSTIHSSLVPKDTVVDLESYTYYSNEVTHSISDFMKETGFDAVQTHVFKWKGDKKITYNLTFLDLADSDREGMVYLHRADMEEVDKIRYVSNGAYLIIDPSLLANLRPIIDHGINQYNNRSLWYRFKKKFNSLYSSYFTKSPKNSNY